MNASHRILGVVPRLFEVLPGRIGPFQGSPAVVDAARRLGVALGVAVRCVPGVVEDLDAAWVERGDGVHSGSYSGNAVRRPGASLRTTRIDATLKLRVCTLRRCPELFVHLHAIAQSGLASVL